MFRPTLKLSRFLAPRRKGFTLPELLVTVLIASMIAAFVVYMLVFTARMYRVIFAQMSVQNDATIQIQRITDDLRNADFDTITISNNDSRLEFTSLEDGNNARIEFVNDKLTYYPNLDDQSSKFEVTKLDDVTFTEFVDPDTGDVVPSIIQINGSFKYPRFIGYGDGDSEQSKTLVLTRIFIRNN